MLLILIRCTSLLFARQSKKQKNIFSVAQLWFNKRQHGKDVSVKTSLSSVSQKEASCATLTSQIKAIIFKLFRLRSDDANALGIKATTITKTCKSICCVVNHPVSSQLPHNTHEIETPLESIKKFDEFLLFSAYMLWVRFFPPSAQSVYT